MVHLTEKLSEEAHGVAQLPLCGTKLDL